MNVTEEEATVSLDEITPDLLVWSPSAQEILKAADPDARARWFRGKRGAILTAVWSMNHPVSRTTAYEMNKAGNVIKALSKANLITQNHDIRDAETGRRVSTILREIGRLGLEDEAEIIEVYEELRTHSIDEVKRIVRIVNRDCSNFEQSEGGMS